MDPKHYNNNRLEELLLIAKDPLFSNTERKELNELLRNNAEAREFATQFLYHEVILTENLSAVESENFYQTEEFEGTSKLKKVRQRKGFWITSAVTTSCLILVATALISNKRSEPVDSKFVEHKESTNSSSEKLTKKDVTPSKPVPEIASTEELNLSKFDKPEHSEHPPSTPIPSKDTYSKGLSDKPKALLAEKAPPILDHKPSKQPTKAQNHKRPLAPPITVGIVNSTQNSSTEWKPGNELKTGKHQIKRGIIELRLASKQRDNSTPKKISPYDQGFDWKESYPTDVRLFVEGPAQFNLHSASHFELISGKLSAEVFPLGKGFTVTTNSLEVVDLGTRFAISSNTNNDTSFHVYDGLVTGKAKDSSKKPITFYSGDTVRLNTDSNRLEKIEFKISNFITSPKWTGEIEEYSPNVRFLAKAPRKLDDKKLFSKHEAIIFKERAGAKIRRDLDVFNITGKIRGAYPEAIQGEITKGALVDSYLIHSDGEPQGYTRVTVRFNSPILGIIFNPQGLNESDRSLGAHRTNYPMGEARGLEKSDRIYLDNNRRTLSIDFIGEHHDQVRVLVAKDS